MIWFRATKVLIPTRYVAVLVGNKTAKEKKRHEKVVNVGRNYWSKKKLGIYSLLHCNFEFRHCEDELNLMSY